MSSSDSDLKIQPVVTQPRLATKLKQSSRQAKSWLSASVLSVLFHLLIFGLCVFLLTKVPKGTGSTQDRDAGIVLVERNVDKIEYLTEGDFLEASDSRLVKPMNDSPPELDLPPDLPGLSSLEMAHSNNNLTQPTSDNALGDQQLQLNQVGKKLGGKVTTELFGLKGTGSCFVYLVDRSESMTGRALNAVKTQLQKSLNVLEDKHQFQIIFYNNSQLFFNEDDTNTFYASKKTKEQASHFIQQQIAQGGTNHISGFEKAFRFKPDVIFFLTDADTNSEPLTNNDLKKIKQWNRFDAIINVIKFGESRGNSEKFERLANQHGGQFIFKNISLIPEN